MDMFQPPPNIKVEDYPLWADEQTLKRLKEEAQVLAEQIKEYEARVERLRARKNNES